jgi:hypothetical protein
MNASTSPPGCRPRLRRGPQRLLPHALLFILLAWAGGCGGRTYDLGAVRGHDSTTTVNTPGAGDGGANGFSSGPDCTTASVTCSGGAVGWSCTDPNGTPRTAQPNLSCTEGNLDGPGGTIYCCFDFTSRQGRGCVPLDDFPCGEYSYAYECRPGALPSAIDTRLSCGDSFPAANGQNDFCCTLQ